jgi:hypothetical protein
MHTLLKIVFFYLFTILLLFSVFTRGELRVLIGGFFDDVTFDKLQIQSAEMPKAS